MARNSIRLHCDACHHEIEVERLTRDIIGTPCPICHTNMLTADDYRTARRMRLLLGFLRLVGVLREHRGDEQPSRIGIHVHHGTYDVKVHPPEGA